MNSINNKLKITISAYRRKWRHLVYDTKVLFRIQYPYMFYKYSFLYNISENIRYFLTGWKRSLIWCPSQLTKSIKYKGKSYELYGRWRWDDPWSGYIIIKDHRGRYKLWSEELLSEYNYVDYDIRKVEKTLDTLFKEIIINQNKVIKFI